MLHFLPTPLILVINAVALVLNTLFWAVPIYIVVVIRLLIPVKSVRRLCAKTAVFFAENWIAVNNLMFDLTHDLDWHISGVDELRYDDWYLVLSNHQSWTDIFVLQYVFNRKIPFLKFFIKQELIWVPVIGLAWWGLEFPFMKRYSRKKLEKHPHLKGKDLETTLKACAKFKDAPVTIMNFAEGTRFTHAKHQKQQSPYGRLLKPKAGGIALAIAALHPKMHTILDVTIAYPNGKHRFWDFFSGKTERIDVHVEKRPLPTPILNGDYSNDPAFKAAFQAYISDIWEEKDMRLERMMGKRREEQDANDANLHKSKRI